MSEIAQDIVVTRATARLRSSAIVAVRRAVGQLLLYLVLTVLAVILLVPLAYMVSTSLKVRGTELALPVRWLPSPVAWENYPETITMRPFHLYLRNTLTVVAGAMSGTLLTSSMAAYAFARLRFPGRSLLFSLVLMTMMLPGVVTMVPTFIIFKLLG